MKTTPCAQCPWRKANQGRPPYKTLAETWRTTAETCEKAVNVIAAQRDVQKVVIAEEYPVPNIREAIAAGKFQYAESLLDWVRQWYVKKALRGEIERAKSARHERGENPKVMRSGARIPDSLKARVNVVLGRRKK